MVERGKEPRPQLRSQNVKLSGKDVELHTQLGCLARSGHSFNECVSSSLVNDSTPKINTAKTFTTEA